MEYVRVPRQFVLNAPVSHPAFRLFVVVCALGEDLPSGTVINPTYDQLAEMAGLLGAEQARECAEELVRLGWISRGEE